MVYAAAEFSNVIRGKDELFELDLPDYTSSGDDLLHQTSHEQIRMKTICTALQNGCGMGTLRWYLKQRKDYMLHTEFRDTMKAYGCSALFYAVERNSVEAVQLLLEFGADPDTCKCSRTPLLAFAIFHGRRKPTNTTEVVRQLLAHGANPRVIPEDTWIKYWNDPRVTHSTPHSQDASWCTPPKRRELVDAMHLTHRYSLYRASRLDKPTDRKVQIASDHRIFNLFKIPYFMIGQLPAAKLIMNTMFGHISNHNPRPLVMVFAGPSGHGKTELALQMGDLLSVKHQVFACEKMQYRMDLLGGSNSYHRSDEGSEFNNFVSNNSGKMAVVVLDEFDKTTDEVRLSLLGVIDKGTFSDRRTNRKVDCSKFIWVLATNFGDTNIHAYYKHHIEGLKDEDREMVDLSSLQKELIEAFKTQYGAPLTGRTKLMVPFLPFSNTEAAVVYHKFFMEYQDRLRKDIDLREDVRRHIAHIDMNLYEDGDFSSKMASKYYSEAMGARSVLQAVDIVETKVTNAFVRTPGLVTEAMNQEPLQKYTVKLVPQGNGGNEYEIEVFPELANGS